MKILHICQRDDPGTGGSLRVAEALVREQRKAGVDARVLFLYGAPSGVSESLAPHAMSLGLESSREALWGIWMLRRAVRKNTPDIIHSHDGILWPRLSYFCNGIPVVMHSHLPIGNSSEFKQNTGKLLVKMTTDILIGISTHTIETWVNDNFPPSRIHYVPNGVDFDRFKILNAYEKSNLRQDLGLPENKRILLWVGRVHCEMKGSDRVERIAVQLPEDTVLVVVGTGPDFSGMKERCTELIAAGRMVMIGASCAPEKYYQAADAYLFTSYHEPFGLVILEAVASGLPIIAFPVTGGGGAGQLLEEFRAGMLSDEATQTEIHAVLERSAERGAEIQNLRLHAIDKYSWKSISKMIVDTYKIVLNKKL